MKRRAIRDNSLLPDELGQDSFLDTIFNLVGVLIILVVVVGAHARNMCQTDSTQLQLKSEIERASNEVAQHQLTEESVRADNWELERQIQSEEQLAQLRSLERTQVLALLTQLDDEVARQKAECGDSERESLERQDQKRQLKSRLESVEQRTSAIWAEIEQVRAIDHYPTPIAKTVFRDDVHFRLKDGRIAFVPLEELIQRMRGEWEVKAEKLATTDRVVEVVGPVSGFRLQYSLVARQLKRSSPAGPITQRSIEFDHFSVIPPLDSIGESFEDAIRPGSALLTQIARLSPEKHTISVWVYPDSYPQFNQLKSWLYERGFQTATWPLSADGLISGGPNGYRSSAQ